MILENVRVNGNEFTLDDVTLDTCHYAWRVEIYNAEGIIIASMPGFLYFNNVNLPENC